jgi:Domain of unknown function (DUF892)
MPPSLGVLCAELKPKERPMKIEDLKDLFVHTLNDIYFAERQIVKSLPKMIKTAHYGAGCPTVGLSLLRA